MVGSLELLMLSLSSYNKKIIIRYWQGDKKPDVVDFMSRNYPPGFTYADFAHDFTAEFFDPDYWADLFQESGAKYNMLITI